MTSPGFIFLLFFVVCFTCATLLNGWRQNWEGSRREASNALAFLMGDSRRIFANHFFARADLYFHSGYYPSIFDSQKKEERSHLEETSGHDHDEHCDHDDDEDRDEDERAEGSFLGKPRDIIDRFGRNFYVTSHSHLAKNEEREMLPWLKLSASLDPQKVQTYTVASYWLRTKLGKAEEAERFLREGQRNNPDSFEILFELGKIRQEHYDDASGARNLWELALQKWQQQEAAGSKPSEFVYAQILGNLAVLEEQNGNYAAAIRHFELLKRITPMPESIEKRIEDLRQQQAKQ